MKFMKRDKKEWVLLYSPRYIYKSNIKHPFIEPLYLYFRKRLMVGPYDIGYGREVFDKIIINMARRGEIYVPVWVLRHSGILAFSSARWYELMGETIKTTGGTELSYSLIRDEIVGLNRLLTLTRTKKYSKLKEVSEDMPERVLEFYENFICNGE